MNDATAEEKPRKSFFYRWARRLAIGGLGLLLLAAVWQQFMSWSFLRANPHFGEMVDVGGHRLHVVKRGTRQDGTPAVVVNHGIGDSVVSWVHIQEKLEDSTEIFLYDRAGLGWSDYSKKEKTMAESMRQLRTCLEKSGVAPPYILIGHSYGGEQMRMFAQRHPDEVAGVILVDAVNAATIDADTKLPLAFKLFAHSSYVGVPRLVYAFRACFSGEKAPRPLIEPFRREWNSNPKLWYTIVGEIEDGLRWARENKGEDRKVGDVPFYVVWSSQNTDEDWQKGQNEFLSLSSNATEMKVDCGHEINLERPDVIVSLVKKMLQPATVSETAQ